MHETEYTTKGLSKGERNEFEFGSTKINRVLLFGQTWQVFLSLLICVWRDCRANALFIREKPN